MAAKRPRGNRSAGTRDEARAPQVPEPDSDPKRQAPYRILSIDGGGIYGVVSALWLKELCLRDESFLAPDGPGSVKLFAGISAGGGSLACFPG